MILLFGASLSFYSYFAKFEDDTLGLPFVFLSLYFLVKWVKEKQWYDFFWSLFIASVGFFVWKGMAIWILIVLASSPITWIFSGGMLYYFREKIISFQYGSVAEQIPLAGVLSNALILPGMFTVPIYLIPSISLAFMLAMVHLKYSLFFGLLCAIGLYSYLCQHDFFEFDERKVLGLPKQKALFIILFMISIAGLTAFYSSPPTKDTVDFVRDASRQVNATGNNLVYTDWEFGHLIQFYGMVPSNQFGPPNHSFAHVKGYVITHQLIHCNELRRLEDVRFYYCD